MSKIKTGGNYSQVLKNKKKVSLDDLLAKVAKTKGKKMELNEDDKIIYGVED